MKKHEETTLASYNAIMYALTEVEGLRMIGGDKFIYSQLKQVFERGLYITYDVRSMQESNLKELLGELRDEIVRLAEHVYTVIDIDKEVLIGVVCVRSLLDTVCLNLDKVTTGMVNVVEKVYALRKLNDYMDKEKPKD